MKNLFLAFVLFLTTNVMAVNVMDYRMNPIFEIPYALDVYSQYYYTDPVPYVYTGTFSAQNEAEYNLIVWSDLRTQPTWSEVSSFYIFFMNNYYLPNAVSYRQLHDLIMPIIDAKVAQSVFDTLSGTVTSQGTTLAAKADTSAMTSAMSAKADNTTVSSLATLVATKADSSAVSSLTTTVGTKADTSALSALSTTVAGKANTSHTHAQADITNLVTNLAAKAALSHTHSESDVTNLVADLAKKLESMGLSNVGVVPVSGTINATTGEVTLYPNTTGAAGGTNYFSSIIYPDVVAYDASGTAITGAFEVVKSESASSVTMRFIKGKNQAVLLAGAFDTTSLSGALSVKGLIYGVKL